MNNPQFTSGPWHVSENQPTVVGNKEKAVCKCELDWDLGANERKANAALIAAAPEMYAMLERILDFKTGGPFISTNPSVTELAHLLMKARGEE
jgi:hypothetical protein